MLQEELCYVTSSASKRLSWSGSTKTLSLSSNLTFQPLLFLSAPVFGTCLKFILWTFSSDSVCLLYLHPLYLFKQPHLLILLVAKFTATLLRPVLGLMPQWMANVPAADSLWKKKRPSPSWGCERVVKVYYFINVYGIPPPPLQTQPLTVSVCDCTLKF